MAGWVNMQLTSDSHFDSPLRRQRAGYPHWISERVRWSDTDMAGHANNLTFGAFCEAGRALLLKDIMHPASPHHALLVLAEFRLCFLSEMHWPEDIDIGTAITVIGNSACVTGQGLFQGDRCVAVADSRLVLIDETTRRGRSLTPEILQLLTRWQWRPVKGE